MPRNPIEEKDMKIDELEKAFALQKTEMSELSQMKESLTKTKAELYSVKQNYNVSIKKLNYTKNATEQKIAEAISNPDFFRDDPHLVSVYTATLNMDDFDVAETTDDLLPKNDNFLKKVESIDQSNSTHTERYQHFKNQILEKVKSTKNRQRTFSGSSVTSQASRSSGRKRVSSGGQNGKSPTRVKSGIPAPKPQK